MLYSRILLIIFSTMSFSSYAAQCGINFNYGVVIDPIHVRMVEDGKTYVQINHDQQLFIGGREVELTPEQQQLINQYATGVRQQLPNLVYIAIEGVEIALKTVDKVIGGLTGENSASHQKIKEKFEDMQNRLRLRFNHSSNSFYIAPQDFDEFDEIFAGQFEQEIEEIITQSIGTLLSVVGEAMANKDEESIEQRLDAFDQRMDHMGKDLELEIGTKADQLENKAQQFCQNLKALNALENKLQLSIPQLASFDLIGTTKQKP